MFRFIWRMGITLALFLPAFAWAHGVSAADQARMMNGSILDYVGLGAVHMVTGYDHLLFLFGVVFFLTNFRDIVKFISVFTLGHSVTLIAATFMGIHANYYLIDAVIALSVIYKGFDNLDGFRKGLKMEPPNLLWMVFGFGLIHGFGLSTRLQQLPLPEHGLLSRIIAFNVGVELGQIAALAIMLLLIAAWRRSKTFVSFSIAANAALMAAGAFLFLMQMHGYAHTRHPDDFGFATDEHIHVHQKMDAEQTETIKITPQSAPGKDTLY